MEITRGKIQKAKKVVIYGPEGIGKSTFAARFPGAVFIDTEGSTNDMDVARLPRPTSWNMLFDEIEYIKTHTDECRTLVIDTVDWAELLCVEHICAVHNKKGIEDFGYGNGYVYTKEEFGRFLNKLSDLIEVGINVVLTAHAQLRKFEQPDELGAYDRWELKLGKKTQSQTSPLVKEWADMLLFANYKTFSVAVGKDGKKHKGQGGKRTMYTQHHPCWDAKNRFGLPEECEFDYSVIAEIIEGTKKSVPAPKEEKPIEIQKPSVKDNDFMNIPKDTDEKVDFDTGAKVEEPVKSTGTKVEDSVFHIAEYIPKALRDLMYPNLVSEVQQAWDKQANFLSAQARAQKTLEGMINRYEDLLHKNWDLATDEQKARILQIKANTERMKSSGNDDGEDGVVIVNDAPTGEDIRHSDTEVPADIQQQDS